LPKNTIAIWDEMANKFLTKYFTPAKSAKNLRWYHNLYPIWYWIYLWCL